MSCGVFYNFDYNRDKFKIYYGWRSMKNKHNSLVKPFAPRERLSEIGSLLATAIMRLQTKERDRFSKNSLDFGLKQSVTSAATSYERLKS